METPPTTKNHSETTDLKPTHRPRFAGVVSVGNDPTTMRDIREFRHERVTPRTFLDSDRGPSVRQWNEIGRKGTFSMTRAWVRTVGVVVFLLVGSVVSAQTTQPGDAIDIEIINPADGSNRFCVASAATIEARVFVRPGSDSLSCTLSCSGPSVAGGSANIATTVIDLGFDSTILTYVDGSIASNGATAAVQGLPQVQNVAEHRVGWALAGSWSTPGNTNSSLLSPCDTQMITTSDWLFSVQFQATGAGMTNIRLRRETDVAPFALSFADICGTEAFKVSNGGIDEVRDAVVMVATDCQDVIFFDNFGTGDSALWTETQ